MFLPYVILLSLETDPPLKKRFLLRAMTCQFLSNALPG